MPALTMPGTDAISARSSRLKSSNRSRPIDSGKRTKASVMPSCRMPVSTDMRFLKLATKSIAATSRTTAIAICVVTINRCISNRS